MTANCTSCFHRLDLINYDYSDKGCKHTKMDGYVCLAFADEGKAIWMTNCDEDTDICECYTKADGLD